MAVAAARVPVESGCMDDTPRETADRAHERRSDLDALAEEQAEAVWSDSDAPATRAPGMSLLAGEVGGKGTVGAQLRATTRLQNAAGREVPRGMAAPGTGRYLAAFVALVTLAGLGLVVLIGWLTSGQ